MSTTLGPRYVDRPQHLYVAHLPLQGAVAGPSTVRGGHRNAEAGPSKPQTKRARCDTHTLKKKHDNARAAAQVAQKKEQIDNVSRQAAYVYVGNVRSLPLPSIPCFLLLHS